MQVLLRAKALHAAQHGRAGELPFAQQLEDRLIERLAVPLVALAQVDAHQQTGSFELHEIALPSARPPTTAIKPSATEPPRFKAASSHAPSSIMRQLSSA